MFLPVQWLTQADDFFPTTLYYYDSCILLTAQRIARQNFENIRKEITQANRRSKPNTRN